MSFMLGDAGGTAGPALRSHLDSQRRQSVPDPQSHPSPDNGAPSMTSRVRLPGSLRPRTAYRAAAAAAAIVTISALAACGSSGGSSGGDAAAATTAGASGTLNWEWALPTSWDPVTSSAGWDMHALGLVYASITTLDAKGTVQAGLARSWKYAANG